MIAVSIALVIWTAGLSYLTSRDERARRDEATVDIQPNIEKEGLA